MYLKGFIVCLLLWPLIATAAQAPPLITWVKNNAPPFYLLDDPGGETGFGDRLQTLLEGELTNHVHQTVRLPLSRVDSSWGSFDPLCFATMIYETPLNERYLLSIPYTLYLPHGIIATREFVQTLPRDAAGTVALEPLLSARRLRLGHITGRTYGRTLDNLLARHQDSLTVTQRAGANETDGVLDMLQYGRFDLVLEYGFVLNHLPANQSGGAPLEFVPISETRDEVVLGAVGCSNNQAGREALMAINDALRRIVSSERFLRAVSRWLVPAGEQMRYWMLFEQEVYPRMLPSSAK